MKDKFLILTSLCFLISCESNDSNQTCHLVENSRSLNAVTKILFIGNSHTHVNDIPKTIELMAKSTGDSTYIKQQTPGGYSFDWHSDRKETLDEIELEKWDYVVLQEQGGIQALPTFMADTAIYQYAGILINAIRKNRVDTKVILYMTHAYRDGVLTWGDENWCEQDPVVCNYEGMQQRVRDNYVEMSNLFEAEIAPAGMIWKIIIDNNYGIDLFSSDGVHATPTGSYISACTIYSTIFQKSPVGKYVPSGIEESSMIQNTVYEVLFHCNPDWRNY